MGKLEYYMKINGIIIKTPSTYTVDTYDIDAESYRNAKGDLVRDRIGTKRKISCTWNALTQSQISTLLGTVENEFFPVYYLDPRLGYTTKTFYVGDRSSPAWTLVNGKEIWENLSMNFIER